MAKLTFLVFVALMFAVVAFASAGEDSNKGDQCYEDKCYKCPDKYECYKKSGKDSSKCWCPEYCYYKCDEGRECEDKYSPAWCPSNDKHSCKDKEHCYYLCPPGKPHCKPEECYGDKKDERKCSDKKWCYKGECKSQGKKCKNPCPWDDGHGSYCQDDKCE